MKQVTRTCNFTYFIMRKIIQADEQAVSKENEAVKHNQESAAHNETKRFWSEMEALE